MLPLTDLYTVAIFSFLNADFINNLDPMNRIFSSVQQIQPISSFLNFDKKKLTNASDNLEYIPQFMQCFLVSQI